MRRDDDLKSDVLVDLNDDFLFFPGDFVAAEDPREPAADLLSLSVVGDDSSCTRDILQDQSSLVVESQDVMATVNIL